MTLTLDFQDEFWESCFPEMGLPIDVERKECESVGSQTLFVTLRYEAMNSSLNFQGQTLKNFVSKEWDGWYMEHKGKGSE